MLIGLLVLVPWLGLAVGAASGALGGALTAAALTYLAAAITSILQLLYYLSVANRRR